MTSVSFGSVASSAVAAVGVEVGPLREDDEIGAQRSLDGVVRRDAHRVGEHRDAGDEREPDHQRRCRQRRAPRVAPCILAGEQSGSTAQPSDGPPDHRRDRNHEQWGEQRHAQEHAEETRADELQRDAVGGEEPRHQSGAAEHEDHQADRDAPARQVLRLRQRLRTAPRPERCGLPGVREGLPR